MTDLFNKTAICLGYLRSLSAERLSERTITANKEFRDWLQAFYADPSVSEVGDAMKVYEACRNKRIEGLTPEQVNGCILFLVRQIRFQYPPYTCIVSGELAGLLERWLQIAKEEAV